jgi:molecular chaperone DnaJ
MSATITGYYDLLNISKDASADEIKKAFRQLAHKFHPDKNKGDKEAEVKFKEISKAYEVLIDPQSRMMYDRTGNGDYHNFIREGYSGNPFGGPSGFTGRGRGCGAGRGCGFKRFRSNASGNFFNNNSQIYEITISEEDAGKGIAISVKPENLNSDRTYTIKLPEGIKDGSLMRCVDEETGNDFYIKIKYS